MSLQKLLILTSFFVCAHSLVNTKCFQWIYNDGSDCSTYLPGINLLPVPEVLSHTVTCKDGTTFTNKAGSPWECHLFNPDCLETIKPQFTITTPDKKVITIDYDEYEGNVKSAAIDASKPLFVVVHGFGTSWPLAWVVDMKNALVALGNNVMVVRWTSAAGSLLDGSLYIKAAANTQAVGKGIANVVNAMVNASKAKVETTTIVGFSLGAHVAGYAGNGIKGLKRIIGLDPAGPMFACYHPDSRLDETDAEFVEVIHTNGDTFALGGAGTLQRLGTVDFYANGGWLQPGCGRGVPQVIFDILHPSFVFSVLSLNFTMLADDASCNHGRAPRYFIESIKNAAKNDTGCKFAAFPCESDTKFDAGECYKCKKADKKNDKRSADKDDKKADKKDADKDDKKGGCEYVNAGLPLTGVTTASEGKYYFKTFAHNVSGFCGTEFFISLTSNVDVKGSILIELFSTKNITRLISFQNETEYLTAKTPKQIVVLTQWDIQDVQSATITYNRYRSAWYIVSLLNSGTKQWKLSSATITDSRGKVVKAKKDLEVYDADGLKVDFS